MPAKTKTKSSGVAKASAEKKPVAKKVSVKKTTPKKKPAAGKATPVKKARAVKKKVAKKPVAKVVAEVKPVDVVEIQKEFVVVHSCNNCDHMPIRVGKLVGIFTFIIAVLSTVILIQLGLINLEQVLVAVSTPVSAATEWVNNVR